MREREAEKKRANAYPSHRFQLDKKKGPGKMSGFGGVVGGVLVFLANKIWAGRELRQSSGVQH